jgi:type IV pilus assembly protein PilP
MKNNAVLLGCGLLLLSGCSGGEHDDLRAWMASNAKQTPVKIPPIPQVAPYTASHYQPEGTLDPFKAGKILPESGKSGGGARPDLNRQKEELELYPLESLVFVGLLQRGKENHAIVKADSSLHKVKVGNYLGQDFGVVTQISDFEISLRELIQDAGGDWVERTSTLQLQEQKESKK